MSAIVKCEFEGDIRRFRLEKDACFEDLVVSLAQLYKLQGIFTVKYKDQEEDWITLTTETELNEARNQSAKIIRLQVQSKSKTGNPHSTDEILLHSERREDGHKCTVDIESIVEELVNTPLLREHITQLVVQTIKKEMIPQMAPLFESLAKVQPDLVNENIAKEAIPILQGELENRDREIDRLVKQMEELGQIGSPPQSEPKDIPGKLSEDEKEIDQESPPASPVNSPSDSPQNSPRKLPFFPFISSFFNRQPKEEVPVLENLVPEPEKEMPELEQKLEVIASMGFVVDAKVRELVVKHKGDLSAVIGLLLNGC